LEVLAKARAAGHPIGAIVSLPLSELAQLAGEGIQLGTVADAVSSLAALDPAVLDQELQRGLKAFGRLEFIDGFMFPFVKSVKMAIAEGRLRPAHLSLAQARLREILALVEASSPLRDDAPRVVISSAQGYEHEPGLLGSAIHAASAGWRPIRFSPGTSAEELAFAATSMQARAVVYSILQSSESTGAVAEAILVRRMTPSVVPVFFGGRLDPGTTETLSGAGLERIADMQGLRKRLADLAASPPA
jgi:methylmalonyl-CoA mutase cobalamin-binding subunit